MGNIYFPMPSWGWWHGCHWLLLSHMALHYNGASESKSPRRPRPVCLADRLWCKRLVIVCNSKQDNCLVKDEWRQIGLRRLFPWSASTEWACVSEHKWEVTTGSAPSSSTKGCTDKNTYSDCMVGTTPCGRSGQLFSLSVCVCVRAIVCLYFLVFFPSASLSLGLRCLGVFGQFVPVALDFQADLANFWSVQYRKQFFCPSWWMQLGADPRPCICRGVSLCCSLTCFTSTALHQLLKRFIYGLFSTKSL